MKRICVTSALLLFALLQVELVWLRWFSKPAAAESGASGVGADRNGGDNSTSVRDIDHPCGPIAMSVIAQLIGKSVTLAEAGDVVKPDALGRVSMAELVAGLEKLGFAARGVRIHPNKCRETRSQVVIFHRGDHFSVVLTHGGSHVTLIDPPFRPEVLSVKALIDDGWQGEAVLVARSREELDQQLASFVVSQ